MYEGETYFSVNKPESLRKFEEVLQLESENNLNDKSFKCLQMITILSGELGDYEKSKDSCTKLLSKSESVGRNEVEEAITSIIEFANKMPNKEYSGIIVNKILTFLKTNNRNLWLQTCINLGNIYINQNEFQLLEKLIRDCKDTFTLADGSFDKTQSGLLEIFALEI